MSHTSSPSPSAATKRQRHSRGEWDEERKLVLMEAYAKFQPFGARYGQTAKAWNRVLDAVNSVHGDILAPLTLNGIKRKKDTLFAQISPEFEKHRGESLMSIKEKIPTKVGVATFLAMQEVSNSEEEYKEDKLVGRRRYSIRDNREEAMSLALYRGQLGESTKSPSENTVDSEEESEGAKDTLTQKILDILKMELKYLDNDKARNDKASETRDIAASLKKIANNSERISNSLEMIATTLEQVVEILKK
ncbi:hypothetical protein CLU79DRAFT_498161 [Phycomyces nitens]|nr:hypothetical protein CLU79DRAFT_498161 [Phycomyces nitens]